MAIRIDGDRIRRPARSRCTRRWRPRSYDVKLDGISTAELRFSVPDTLAHPGGLDNAVVKVTTTINKETGKAKVKGEERTVGFYSAVGRKGKTRTVRVTFIDESGAKYTADPEGVAGPRQSIRCSDGAPSGAPSSFRRGDRFQV